MLSYIWNNMWVMLIMGYVSLTILMIYLRVKGSKVNEESATKDILEFLSFALLTLSIGGVCMLRFAYIFVDYIMTVTGVF